MPKTIEPVELWIPEYEKRTPADLFANEFAINPENHDIARKIGAKVIDGAKEYVKPEVLDVLSSGPTVIAFNHMSYFDPPAVGAYLLGKGAGVVEFVAMAELFTKRRPEVAAFIASIGGFPIDRARAGNGDKVHMMHFLKMCMYVLTELKRPLVIYPEGGIHEKPHRYPHKVSPVTDTALVVSRLSKVPLVVGGLSGMRSAPIRAVAPGVRQKVGISMAHVFEPRELKHESQLQMHMQTASNIARSVRRQKD